MTFNTSPSVKPMMCEREIISINPYDQSVVGAVRPALESDVSAAFEVAVDAQKVWAAVGFESRCEILRSYAALLKEEAEELADLITREAGKPLWESRTEVQAMINKVEISIDAHQDRCGEFAKGIGVTRFQALGVVGVLGPFNFPGHLPNGHIVPALLAGNAVLFKPSEFTPLVGQFIVDCLHQAGVPQVIVQVLHGEADIGRAIVALEGLRGLFFTGSSKAGLSIHKALAGRPQTLLALEMGGNNPLLVDQVEDIAAASRLVCQSAFITAGQRCTCARRVLIPAGKWGDAFLDQLKTDVSLIEVGNPSGEQQPYMGTVISSAAADNVLKFEATLVRRGAKPILPLKGFEDRSALLECVVRSDATIGCHFKDELVVVHLLTNTGVFHVILDEFNRAEKGIDSNNADCLLFLLVVFAGAVATTNTDFKFSEETLLLLERADDLVRVDDFNVRVFLDVSCSDRTFASDVDHKINGIACFGYKKHLLKIEDDVGDIFHNTFDALELVLHTLNLDGGNRSTFNRAKKDTAKGVSNRVSVTCLKRLGLENGKCVGSCFFYFNQSVG